MSSRRTSQRPSRRPRFSSSREWARLALAWRCSSENSWWSRCARTSAPAGPSSASALACRRCSSRQRRALASLDLASCLAPSVGLTSRRTVCASRRSGGTVWRRRSRRRCSARWRRETRSTLSTPSACRAPRPSRRGCSARPSTAIGSSRASPTARSPRSSSTPRSLAPSGSRCSEPSSPRRPQSRRRARSPPPPPEAVARGRGSARASCPRALAAASSPASTCAPTTRATSW
mmetsp:Transcript_29617/g.88637  ORF Transcript_29617/g.88637 Transcript_29617/m.88637 type:complete len:233 (+) Transcript_29617:112-810(+)